MTVSTEPIVVIREALAYLHGYARSYDIEQPGLDEEYAAALAAVDAVGRNARRDEAIAYRENETLREALEWYANADNWEKGEARGDNHRSHTNWDRGEHARAALAGGTAAQVSREEMGIDPANRYDGAAGGTAALETPIRAGKYGCRCVECRRAAREDA